MLDESELSRRGNNEPTRALHWVAATDPVNRDALQILEARMHAYYEKDESYYDSIAFSGTAWTDPQQLAHQHLLTNVHNRQVLEIGCGSAPILQTGSLIESQYTGCDFNPALLAANARRHPGARFVRLTDAKTIPLEQTFEAVFSVFVLEHCVFPQNFLSETLRLLAPGGFFGLLCPDFLGRSRMSSQRLGFSAGTGREKLRQKKWRDAFTTAFDNRIRIPWLCRGMRRRALTQPQFFVNLEPTCFTDPFQPDVDAVYVTFEAEIRRFLGRRISFVEPDDALRAFVQQNRLIYLAGFGT